MELTLPPTPNNQEGDAGQIDPKEWGFVQDLLADVQAEAVRNKLKETVVECFGQWKLLVNAFRRVEEKRMLIRTPSLRDYLFHKRLITELISIGSEIKLCHEICRKEAKINEELLNAILSGLQNSFEAFHSPANEGRIENLRSKIFSAA